MLTTEVHITNWWKRQRILSVIKSTNHISDIALKMIKFLSSIGFHLACMLFCLLLHISQHIEMLMMGTTAGYLYSVSLYSKIKLLAFHLSECARIWNIEQGKAHFTIQICWSQWNSTGVASIHCWLVKIKSISLHNSNMSFQVDACHIKSQVAATLSTKYL